MLPQSLPLSYTFPSPNYLLPCVFYTQKNPVWVLLNSIAVDALNRENCENNMYRLNRLTSANNLRTLFTAAAAHPKQLSRRSPPARSIPLTRSFRHRLTDASPPASTAGISYFADVGEGSAPSINDSRKVLPPELSRSVVTLTCESSAPGGICDVYLVGTAHGSVESYLQVQAVIKFLKPQVVFLELCSIREVCLYPHKPKVPTIGEMVDMWIKNVNLFGILYKWHLAKAASKLDVLPTAEFRVAYEEAMKYGGKVILGDQPIQITMGRSWAKMSLWHKTNLLHSLLMYPIFLKVMKITKALKETDNLDVLTLAIGDMIKKIPTLMETIIHERDQYMSASLLKVAREHNSVVAVVGKSHLPGIRKNWKQPIEVEQLLSMPSENNGIAVAKIVTSIGATVAIVSGIIYLSIKI